MPINTRPYQMYNIFVLLSYAPAANRYGALTPKTSTGSVRECPAAIYVYLCDVCI